MGPAGTTLGRKKGGGGLDGPCYVEQVLNGPLSSFVVLLEKERGHPMLVVEDGAPSHRSVVAKQARMQLGIHNLQHPPSSPDLNHIKPLWFFIKRRVADTPGSGNLLEALWQATQKAWDELTDEEIWKHTGQMNARVAAVEGAKGWHTRF
jgi:hypothetical protein